MDVRVGPWRKLCTEYLMLLNCGVGETLESSLDCKEIKPVSPKGNQSWIFIGRTDAKIEAPILWPPDAKNQLIGKNPDAGKDSMQEEKGTAQNEKSSITDSMDMSLSKLWELAMDRKCWHAVAHSVAKNRTWVSDWTELRAEREREILESKNIHVQLCEYKFLPPASVSMSWDF